MTTFDAKTFGQYVHDVRLQRELTLRDAAVEIGVSFNTLYRAENGHNMKMDTIARVASWANVSLDSFVNP